MFAPLAIVSGRVNLARALRGRTEVPRVTVVLQAEYLSKSQRMLDGVDVVDDVNFIPELDLLAGMPDTSVAFQPLEELLLSALHHVFSVIPAVVVMPFDVTLSHEIIASMKGQVFSGHMSLLDAFSSGMAVIWYFVEAERNWNLNPLILHRAKAFLNNVEYAVLSKAAWDSDHDWTEELSLDTTNLPQAPPEFKGGAVLVGSLDMV